MLKIEGFFIEHSTAYGSYYGFPKEVFSFLEEGKSYVGIVYIAGASAIKAYSQDAILIALGLLIGTLLNNG